MACNYAVYGTGLFPNFSSLSPVSFEHDSMYKKRDMPYMV